MTLKCTIINKNLESPIVNFLRSKDFVFFDINTFLNEESDKLIIVNPDCNEDEILKIISNLKYINTHFVFFVLPRNFIYLNLPNHYIKIFYPISIKKFEQILSDKLNSRKIFFNDVFIENNNFITHKNNAKKIHFTETEINIIKFLINEKLVKKDKLKTKILNLNIALDTKSLESHISRIRKKFQNLESKISINSIDGHSFRII